MKTLAIGPVREFPSWNWIGADTARELARDFEILPFRDFAAVPETDAVMVVKQRPPSRLAKTLRARGSKLIYLPVDRYEDPAEIQSDAKLLAGCDLLLAHNEQLVEILKPHCARVHFVEHHGKYTLPELAPYRPDGYVLWIGGLQYAPYLLAWLEQHPVGLPVKLLTDSQNPNAIAAARRLARRLGVRLRIDGHSINDHAAYVWSESEQRRMMRECKAAIDIKGEDFNQRTKPPTKAQKFISSGIPFACTADSAASRYFRDRGFAVATPLAEATWFSKEYWEETRGFAAGLRERISITAVGQVYRERLNALWGGTGA